MDSDSFNENLDGRALAFMKTLKRRLMEAKSGHTDDMYHSREWSRTDDSVSFPCSGRTASSSSSRLVDDSCLPGIRDQSRTDVEEVAPHFVMATLICFPESQQAVRWWELHAFGLATRFRNPDTSDHSPGTPPGRHNCVGPGGKGKPVLTNAS